MKMFLQCRAALAIMLCVVGAGVVRAEGGIQFKEGLRWHEILAAAKADNKYIFVNCSTTWCQPCRQMKARVFTDAAVGSYVNSNFIPVAVQMDVTDNDGDQVRMWYADAAMLAAKYQVTAYPTFLFFSPSGELVTRGVGLMGAEALITLAKTATGDLNGYNALKAAYLSGKKDYASAEFLVATASSRNEAAFAHEVARDYIGNYLMKLPDAQLYTVGKLDFIRRNTFSTAEPGFRLFSPVNRKIRSVFPRGQEVGQYVVGSSRLDVVRDPVEQFIDQLVVLEGIAPRISESKKNGIDPPWRDIERAVRKQFDAAVARRTVTREMFNWYSEKEDWPRAVKYFVEMVDIDGFSSLYPFGANVVTTILVMHCEEPAILNKAVKWEQELLAAEDAQASRSEEWLRYGNYGNFAALLYKAGQRDEGIRYLEAVYGFYETDARKKGEAELEKFHNNENLKGYLAALKRMKRGEKIDSTWGDETFF